MNRRILLYITGFFTGMSVMAIELGASRLLAPYFSSSQIVWTIIIGTIMIAMALGNVIGGKMADKYNSPNRLFLMIFIAAIWTALIPLFGKFVISGIALLLALVVSSNYLIWASLLSCLVVFVFPLLVLGMVTPNLIKFAVNDLEENGKVCGIIEALNTIGSIIGTFLPTFVTIPFIGTSWTFITFAAILFVISLGYFIYDKKVKLSNKITKSVVALVVILSGALSSNIKVAFWDNSIIYEGESIYNYLRVEEDDNSIILSTNVLFGVQSIKNKEDGLTGLYYDYALAANSMVEQDSKDMLILGLGTGTYAYQSQYYYGEMNIDGVEIDSKIVDLAREYFDLPSNVNVSINDGRAYLDACKKKYDIIMVDAYQDITIPFQMSSIEFFTMVKNHLNEDGVMVINLNMYSNKEGGINDYILGTVRNVFPNVFSVVAGTNIEAFASFNDIDTVLKERMNDVEDLDLRYRLNDVYNNLVRIEESEYLLTDDKAPVELLGMKVLDEMIKSELKYVKDLIRGKSLAELFSMLMNGELF